MLFLILMPELLLFSGFFLLVFRKIETNHVFVFIVLLALYILGLAIWLGYGMSAISETKATLSKCVNAIADKNFKSIGSIFLLSMVQRSLVSYLFLAHTSALIALVFEYVVLNKFQLESFSTATKSIKKHERVRKTNTEKTLLGFCGKKPIYAQDNGAHFFIPGTTGAGKTVTIGTFANSGFKKKYPMVLIDGKGDVGEGSMLDIVGKLKGTKKVHVVNMTDLNATGSYNPFQNATPTIVTDMLINLTEWSEAYYKANAERYIQCLTTLMELNGINFSFGNIINHFSASKCTELSKKLRTEEVITKEEHTHNLEIIETCSKIAEDALARFSLMAEGEMGKIFTDDGTDVYNVLKNDGVILFILNPLLYPETSKRLGRLILVDIKKAVSFLYTNRKPRTFFILDEINVYASSVLIDLLNKSRSANVTCICATQSLSDLDSACGEDFKEQVIENCNNYIVMRQNSAKNSDALAKILGTHDSFSVTYQLGNGTMDATGKGSATKERKFNYSPDEIRELPRGVAIYKSKDTGEHYLIKVHKSF